MFSCFRYTSILGVMGLLAQYIGVPFLAERMKFHDSTISLIDATTSILNQFVIAFAVNEWMLYIGAAVSFLDYTSTSLFRSMITKNVHANEVGKVFSIVGTFQVCNRSTIITIPKFVYALISFSGINAFRSKSSLWISLQKYSCLFPCCFPAFDCFAKDC